MIQERLNEKDSDKGGDAIHSPALESEGEEPKNFRNLSTKRYEGLGLSEEEAKALLKG